MLCYDVPFWDQNQWNYFSKDKIEDDELANHHFNTMQSKLPSFQNFITEIFHRLYSYDAERLEQKLIRPENQWALKLHESLDENPEFLEFQNLTAGHHVAAGLAAVSFCQTLAVKLPKPNIPLPDPHELRQAVMFHKRNNTNPEMIEKCVKQGKKLVAAHQKYAQDIEQFLSNENRFNELVSDVVGNIQEQLGQAQSLGWGLGDGELALNGDTASKLALIEAIQKTSKIKEIAKLAGRMKRAAVLKQKQRHADARHTVEGLEYGRDLSRVLSSELVATRITEMAPLFYKKYADGELTQFKMGGQDPLGNGPIVICLDESSSMHGKKEIWAKAVTVTLLGIANKQKRDVAVIHYNGSVMLTQHFPYKKRDNSELLKCLQVKPRGGTNWEDPLNNAISLIGNIHSKYNQADIVFITDGEAYLESQFIGKFNKRRSELKTKVYSIVIGANDQTLQAISDKMFNVFKLNEHGEVECLFEI